MRDLGRRITPNSGGRDATTPRIDAVRGGAPVEFRVLGRLEVVGGDGLIELRGSRRRALVGLLLVDPGATCRPIVWRCTYGATTLTP